MSSLGRAAVTKLYSELPLFSVLQNSIFVNLLLTLCIAESCLKLLSPYRMTCIEGQSQHLLPCIKWRLVRVLLTMGALFLLTSRGC